MTVPVVLERNGHVATIVLNRPEQSNAIDPDAARALIACIGAVAADASIRAVVLRGAGAHFCVGGSIAFFDTAGAALPALLEQFIGPLHDAIHQLATLPVPVISAVNGSVAGGGIGLALCADIVLAAESMKLRGGYSAIGLTPDAGASWLLTRRAGAACAKRIFFTNVPLSAQQCIALGIVDEIVPDDELCVRTIRLARTLSQGATEALGSIKRLVDGAHARSLAAQLDMERQLMVGAAASAHAAEGITAFREKRSPRFI